MKIAKYSATGNSFFIIDCRGIDNFEYHEMAKTIYLQAFKASQFEADGLIFLTTSKKADIKMIYFNKDGGEVEMCGNGARSVAHYFFNNIKNKYEINIETMNSIYPSKIQAEKKVSILMSEVNDIDQIKIDDLFNEAIHSLYLKVGVPHCVYLVETLKDEYLNSIAPRIRSDKRFVNGTNVNFIEKKSGDKEFAIRTFERGVEGETLACGTGTTAAAIAINSWFKTKGLIQFNSPGGKLEVELADDIFFSGDVVNHGFFEINIER